MGRIQVIVVIIGSAALLAGLMMIASTTLAAAAPFNPAQEDANYVGSGTCLTCHDALEHVWSDTLHPITIQDAVSNPTSVVADFGTGTALRQLEIGGAARAYTDTDVTFIIGGDSSQRYVMHTGTGYSVLPGQWSVTDGTWGEADAADWLADCADCHTTGYEPQAQSWSELNVGCEACHGAGGLHVETAAYDLPDVVDAATCARCHVGSSSVAGETHDFVIGDSEDWMAVLLNAMGG
jgi:Cytochrome c554 and c-prime